MELKRPEESVAAGYEGNPTADAGLLDQKEVLRSKRWYWCGRRVQDIFFSSLALLVLWPVILIFAVAVVIDSPGASPFFVQERIGRKGKPFKFINLRSMQIVRSLHDRLEYIRTYICTIQTTNFRGAYFRHLDGRFLMVDAS